MCANLSVVVAWGGNVATATAANDIEEGSVGAGSGVISSLRERCHGCPSVARHTAQSKIPW